MGFLTDHPYTAVTVTIDRLVTDQYEEDDVAGIYDLIEAIRLSPSGYVSQIDILKTRY